jgi:4-alpha-glucanotransferase|tara:strand:+ start:488 stop:856 length:369 start_codon:yes stop_codon:yes gene_type:complete
MIEGNKIVSILINHYDVNYINIKYKQMDDFAYFNVDDSELQLNKKYKSLKRSQIKEFLITVLHEIYHAMDSKRYGKENFKERYEMEMNWLVTMGYSLNDNRYELDAESFGRENWKMWKKELV